MNLVGRLLANRYEIIKNIGNGGMATVYKAKCHVLNRMVAVKVLRDEFTTDEEFIKRFNSEAQAVASLTHPNIVSVYDVGNEGDIYYIVMELIQGKTLKEIIVEEGLLSWKWSVNVAMQIASALETAHKNNIVHRDIKPHNILITENGTAKVTDFGIAKAVSNSTITAFGTTIGSVHYFSPEHARGGYTDAKSDIYSLGVVLYEMLTGKVPFDADTPVSIALMHIQEKVIEPITINPQIPKSVNDIVVKAMQKDPNLRYASATDMLADLNLALKNPDGNFVYVNEETSDSKTQKIPVIESQNSKKKENGFIKFVKNHKAICGFIGTILLFVLALSITYFSLNATKLKDVQIPDLANLTVEEAKLELEKLKLEYEELEPEFSPTVPEGQIIKQEPEYRANYKIKEKSIIKVVISKGQELTTVPKVVGMEKDKAIKELEDAKLKAEIIEETNQKIQEGIVISQEIEPRTEINAGETIKIHVSIGTGIEQTSVPVAIGKTEAEAKKLLQDNKLKVQIIYEKDTSNINGIVLKQSKNAGETVDVNTEIVLTVNKIETAKTVNIIVDVKSITGGYSENSNTITSDSDKTVTLEILVDGKSVKKDSVDKNAQSIKKSITGNGTVSVEAKISNKNGAVIWNNTETINLDTQTEYTFKK